MDEAVSEKLFGGGRMTQNEQVLKYMEDFGSITPMDAMSDLGIMRLASRIHDLSQMGYPIKREMVTGKNRYGNKVHYMKYSKGV